MKQILTATAIMLGAITFAQEVEWAPLEKSTGRLLDLETRNANDFFALRWSGGALFGKLEASAHKNMNQTAGEKIELKAPNGSPASFEGSCLLGDHFVVFLSDKQDKQNMFFMQEYGDDLQPESDPEELASYSIENKRRRFQGGFSYRLSQNRDYLGVFWFIPAKKEDNTRFGYKVFDKEMELINEGEFEVPIVSEFSSINEYRVTDYGELYILVKEFEETEERRIFKNYNYKNTHVYLLTGDDYETETIELEDNKRIEAMTFRVDDKRNFTITGTYGDFDARGVTGMFYKQLNFDTGDVGVLSYEEFSEDFITQDWSDRSKKKMEKKKKKGKDVTPILYNYTMRQAKLLKDGSIVGSMEQYYVRVVTTTDPRTGATRTTYYYYYKDIIAFKLNKDGEFDWVQKIDKYQVSTNDNGYFSSYCRYIDGEKLCFLFNDNSDNYDEGSDEYSVTDNAPASSRMSKKKNTVALCTIDLESGDVERKMFFDREELGALAVPKLFNVDYLNNEVLLYAVRWKKEQFGVMDIN